MLFVPDMVINHYSALTTDFLKQQDISLLLCDLDYTLASKKKRTPDQAVKNWVDNMLAQGIQVMIVSNNRSSRRVNEYCQQLKIPYVGHAQKPRAKGFLKAIEKAKGRKESTLVFGDKILTDTLGAHFAGLKVVITEPEGGIHTFGMHFKHLLQEPFKRLSKGDQR